jgi:hypothetical protein
MNSVSTTNLESFVRDWREARGRVMAPFNGAALQLFLDRARPLLREVVSRRPRPATSPDTERLRQALQSLYGPLAEARTTGLFLDPWSVAGLGRREVRNAAVLASFWDRRLCGELAPRFLEACIARVTPSVVHPNPHDLSASYVVRTEHCPLGEASERVDITVEASTFLLGIEVKIDAGEGDTQLQRYREALRVRAALRNVPLTLILLGSRAPRDGIDHHLSWRDVAIAARQVVPPKVVNRTFNERLLAQFAAHVSHF